MDVGLRLTAVRRGCQSLLAFVAVLAAGVLGHSVPALAVPDPIDVHVVVFHDMDHDGVRGEFEPGLGSVRITNGDTIQETNEQGELDLTVDRALYRFATMTIPAGWWPTTKWYHWVPTNLTEPQTVEFGLRGAPETASDPVRWIHVADTQVQTWGDPWRFDEDLEEINDLPFDPLMIINTGDLVEVGSDLTHWNNYMQQIAVSQHPIFHVVGNHDTTGTATPLNNYELYVGPPYYSFEMGSYHFIVYNNEEAGLGTPVEDTWMEQDVAQRAPGSRILLFQHRMVRELPEPKANHWAALGVKAIFSGHWHATQLARQPNGMVDYNLCRMRSGGLDHTSRAFAIVTCEADGTIDYEMRRSAVDHHLGVSNPQPGATVAGDVLDTMLQVYDTSAHVVDAVVTVTGATTSVGPLTMQREGPSLWRLPVQVAGLEPGSCTVAVTGSFDDGTTFAKTVPFTRAIATASVPWIGEDWPMFRREPKGTSFTPNPLEPPLTLAWVQPVPGFVELSSPVTAGGRVFLGTRAENRMTEAGISAFDARTGQHLWYRDLPGGISLAPAVAGNVVVASTMGDSTYGLDAATGAILWKRRKLGVRYDMTAPIVEGPKVYVSAEPRTYQMNWATGTTDWQSTNLGNDWFPYIYSAPAVSPTHLYFGLYGLPNQNYGGFTIVNRTNGSMTFKIDGVYRSPVWADSVVYVVGDDDRTFQKLRKFDPAGNVIWTAPKTVGGGTAAPTLGHGVIVVPGGDGRIEAYNAESGASLWTKTVGYVIYEMSNGVRGGKATSATPAIADSTVYVGSCDGKLYGLDLMTGATEWSWDLKIPVASSAAISGSMLFVGASDNHLYAFTNALPTSPTGAPTTTGTAQLRFEAPRPNPSKTTTTFAFSLPAAGRAKLEVFDVTGRLVKLIADRTFPAGPHTLEWQGVDTHGRHAASGVYYARLTADGKHLTRKLVRLAP